MTQDRTDYRRFYFVVFQKYKSKSIAPIYSTGKEPQYEQKYYMSFIYKYLYRCDMTYFY